MNLVRRTLVLASSIFLCALSVAQFGPQESQGSGPKLSLPTVFPPPGTFPTTESITLLNDDPHATIHYTLDGSEPTSKSAVYDPLRVLFITGIYDGMHGLKTGYTIRAKAMREGHTNSDVATFQFVIDRRDRDQYVSGEILPGVRMVRDSDNDKMFLVKGTKKFALIDSGMGRGPLKQYLSQFTNGMPIEVVFTHNHGDHIGQADQLIGESVEHIGEADLPGLRELLKSRGIADDVIARNAVAAHDGDRIDLGDRSLIIYSAPGHTPGSLVVFDESTGNLFTGDSFGSNSPTIPDALWMQWSKISLDTYLATVKNCRADFRGNVKYMMTGHNDHPLAGEKYLDNLQTALQTLMDKGDPALVPSYRPAGLQQVVIGDRLHDPDWVAVNVNHETFLPAPVDKIDGLTRLAVEGVKLSPAFSPDVKQYTAELPPHTSSVRVIAEPTSSRSKLSLDGNPIASAVPQAVRVRNNGKPILVKVTSPDGSQTSEYSLKLTSK